MRGNRWTWSAAEGVRSGRGLQVGGQLAEPRGVELTGR